MITRLTFSMLGATVLMTVCTSSTVAADPSQFAIASASASLSTTQAGGHPDFTTSFSLTRDTLSGEPFGRLRDLTVELPAGLVANPHAVEQCTVYELGTNQETSHCPVGSQVGITEIFLYGSGSFVEPVYNMAPPFGGSVARFGFMADTFPVLVDVEVRSQGDYGVSAKIESAPSPYPLLEAATTIWGLPADESHDALRLTPLEAAKGETPPGGRKSPVPAAPFMTNPTSCGTPLSVHISADSYQLPERVVEKSASLGTIDGCGKLGFSPELEITPSSSQAAMPTGLLAELTIPQDEAPLGDATAQLRNATVALPSDMVISPGAAEGLVSCSTSQAEFEGSGASRCPDAAKLGSVEFEVPALERPLHGFIYQRSPAPGHLFRLWLIAEEEGVHVVLPGEVQADSKTGQLTAVFNAGTNLTEGLPQVPVARVGLRFESGPRAPLQNPTACGIYHSHYVMTPWSGTSPVSGATPMTIDEGCDTGGFAPRLSAGTANPIAGHFSPFVFLVTREDGEENVSGLDVAIPPGLLAKLTGVPVCPEEAAATGACPAASQVGKLIAAVGPGSSPLWVPQPGKKPTAVYLAGPYKSAPYSLVIVVPAQAGPFDLGTVVTRAGIYVNPETAQVTVHSDPLPQILEGVPLSYRTIYVSLDRSRFTLNPTSCEPMSVVAHLISSAGATATASSRFEVGGCRELGFKAKLSLRLLGKTSRGAHPRLRAVLTMPGHGANIARASVTLPRSEFLDQGHIRTVCTRVQFAASNCPTAAIYGYAKAWSPLLEKPLEGPVYLRSSSHELPDLVVDLRSQIQIVLDGRIDTASNAGIRNTFEVIPDAPLSKFILVMQGGSKGLLVNSTSLCGNRPSHATALFTAHNGRLLRLEPRLANSCRARFLAKGQQPKKHAQRKLALPGRRGAAG